MMAQSPWGYESRGPWMASIEAGNGDLNAILVYSLADAISRVSLIWYQNSNTVRGVIVDGTGAMIWGYDSRSKESVGTRESTNAFIRAIEATGDMDAAIAAASMAEALRANAQSKGLA